MVVKPLAILALFAVAVMPSASADSATPPLLWGTEDVDNITLEWIVDAAADPEEILLTFTAFNGTTETIALPGDVRQATTQKSTGGYYTITYTEEGQAHTSNPWYPLPYPHCFPTNIINPDLIPPVYQTCFFPLPV